MAAPVIESSTDIAELAVDTFNVTKPTGLAVGDLLLAIIAKDDDIGMSAPAGWTTYSNAGGDYSSYHHFKIADSSDVAASNFTFTGDKEDYVGRLYRISGVDTSTPIDVLGTTNTGTSTSPSANSLTTVTDDALVFVYAGMDDNDVPYSLDTAGWTEDLNTSVLTAGIVIGRKVQASFGATGAVDFTTNASDGWATRQIAIRPAAGATTHEGVAVVAGTGNILATATNENQAAASISATGNITALATNEVNGSTAISASGNILATASVDHTGVVSISATGTIDVIGTVAGTQLGEAVISGVGTIDAVASVEHTGIASISASGTVDAAATNEVTGAVAILATGDVDVVAAVLHTGVVAISATGNIDATGTVVSGAVLGAVSINAVGTIDVIATVDHTGITSISCTGNISVTGTVVSIGQTIDGTASQIINTAYGDLFLYANNDDDYFDIE